MEDLMTIRPLLVIGAALILAGGTAGALRTLPGHAAAQQQGAYTLDDGKDLLPRATSTIADAVAAATRAYAGPVGEIDLEYRGDLLVYNVDVGDNDVAVDATTGAVLAATTDD
jgi:uncharacterized membrane protein YkoI